MMLCEVAVMIPVFRNCNADGGSDQTMGLIGCVLAHDTVNDLSRREQLRPFGSGDQFAMRRENAGDLDEIKLGDMGITEGHLEAGQFFFVLTDSLRKKHLCRNEHLTVISLIEYKR
jgi:hypothetical protein